MLHKVTLAHAFRLKQKKNKRKLVIRTQNTKKKLSAVIVTGSHRKF